LDFDSESLGVEQSCYLRLGCSAFPPSDYGLVFADHPPDERN